jgi:hypothetical protein
MMRQSAVDRFGFDFSEVAERSRRTFEVYEEERISLDQYLDWAAWYAEYSPHRS